MRLFTLSCLSALALALAGCIETPTPCTVTDNSDGTATITCPDGSSYTIENGTAGADGEEGSSAYVDVQELPVGDPNCPDGGWAVTYGLEGDDSSELTTEYICNGADGESAYVDVEEIPVGDDRCPNGGVSITVGVGTDPSTYETVTLCNPISGGDLPELTGPTRDLVTGGILDEPRGNRLGYSWDPSDVEVDVALDAPHLADLSPTLECRWGRVDTDGMLLPDTDWAPCPGAPFTPTHDISATGDGLYRTEVRVEGGGEYSDPPASYPYYLHSSLVGAGDCELGADHEAYFAKAASLMGRSRTGSFDTESGPRLDGYAQLSNPFIRLNFSIPTHRGIFFRDDGGYFPEWWGDVDYTEPKLTGHLEVLSLRRRFILSDDGGHVLIYRRYASRRNADPETASTHCTGLSVYRKFGVSGGYTAATSSLCEAVVIDRDGVGVCLGADETGDVQAIAGWDAGDWQIGEWFHGITTHLMPPDDPLRANEDNAMWRELVSDKNNSGAPNSSRNFSGKCYDDPSCAAELDSAPESWRHQGHDGPVPYLYLPDASLYPF